MKRFADFTVYNRKYILAVMLTVCVLCAFLALCVPINANMTKYLPGDSSMKQGLDLMQEEFPDLTMPATIRVMIPSAHEEETENVQAILADLPDVAQVVSKSEGQNTLFTVTTLYGYRTPEELALEHSIKEELKSYGAIVRNDDTTGMEIPVFVFGLATLILLIVLFVLCASWAEPFLFLATIGIAIIMNMGTNLLLGSVSQTTYSMSAVLQLVLSMDYSIILMNRYRQEKERMNAGTSDPAAMSHALLQAFPSIVSSGFTTLVGLTMLVFMHFKIGRDLGLVLAKGVFLSMVCVLTILPALILYFDGAIERTRKRVLYIHTDALSVYSYLIRRVLPVCFALFFVFTWYLQGKAGVSYALQPDDPIAEIFPSENPVVLLFPNEDEAQALDLALELEGREYVTSVYSYVSTLGRQLGPDEMARHLSEVVSTFSGLLPASEDTPEPDFALPDENTLRMLYSFYALQSGGNEKGTLSPDELFRFILDNIDNPLLAPFISKEQKEQLGRMEGLMDYAASQLRGNSVSLMMIATLLPVESEETEAFIRELDSVCREKFSGKCYLIGNSVMGVEMKDGFAREQLMITLLTAAAIFAVVALTFRQLLIPLVLVLLVQCGVFLTITTTRLMGYDMYYLAVVIVQCILMGATVDYGILFTNYYRELRKKLDIKEALRESYGRSMHTILTSSLFMIFGTGAIALSPADPTISEICQSISLGAVSAVLLVIFVLPGLLAGLDRFVVKR